MGPALPFSPGSRPKFHLTLSSEPVWLGNLEEKTRQKKPQKQAVFWQLEPLALFLQLGHKNVLWQHLWMVLCPIWSGEGHATYSRAASSQRQWECCLPGMSFPSCVQDTNRSMRAIDSSAALIPSAGCGSEALLLAVLMILDMSITSCVTSKVVLCFWTLHSLPGSQVEG